jgi:photosystem II stability/assembly factor-like uncharacterized protein
MLGGDAMTDIRRLYAGMHDGVCALTSSDGGDTWQRGPITPLTHAASRLASSASTSRRAYLAAYESGVYRTDDGGESWHRLDQYPCEYAHSLVVHPEDHDRILVGGEPAAIYRSEDGGLTWQECLGFKQVPESDKWFFHSQTRDSHVRDMKLAPHDPDLIYAGIEVGGIVRSKDGGASWQQLEGTDDDIHSVCFSPHSPSTVYAGTARGPFRSDDGGDSWQPITNELPRLYTVPVTPAPDDERCVLLAVANNAGRKGAQAYVSDDGGAQWSRLWDLGADDDMAVAFAWDPVDTQRVYAGTDSGKLYGSADRGRSWHRLNVELPSLAVGALALSVGS